MLFRSQVYTIKVGDSLLEVTQIASGWGSRSAHTCAVTTQGAAKCWGHNGNGQLGDGSNIHSMMPVQVVGLTSGVSSISAGTSISCAVVRGSANCWGLNNTGQLGDGSSTESNVPVQVQGLTSGVTRIGVGFGTACAVVNGAALQLP